MKFLKLKKPHEVLYCVFRGEMLTRDVVFVNGLMLPWADGVFARPGMVSRKRTITNVVAFEILDLQHFVDLPVVCTSTFTNLKPDNVHMLDIGSGVARDIKRCLAKYGDNWIYQIRRWEGAHDADPGAVSVLPERRLNDTEITEINQLKLWNLKMEINHWTKRMLEEHR